MLIQEFNVKKYQANSLLRKFCSEREKERKKRKRKREITTQ